MDGELADSELGVRVGRDGKHVRVWFDGRSVLFSGCTPEALLGDLRACYAAVEFDTYRVSHDGRELAFSVHEQNALRREVALHWARYRLGIKAPVRCTNADLRHPQTLAIVLKSAELKYGAGSPLASALAAATVGVAYPEFERWRRVEADRLSNM